MFNKPIRGFISGVFSLVSCAGASGCGVDDLSTEMSQPSLPANEIEAISKRTGYSDRNINMLYEACSPDEFKKFANTGHPPFCPDRPAQ